MKKMQSLYQQKRKIVLLALLILPCICMACGLKVYTHQLNPEAVSKENYATIIYPRDFKYITYMGKLVSIDGKTAEVGKWGAVDHYQVKPGIHTLVFKKQEYNNPYTKKTSLAERTGVWRAYENNYNKYILYNKVATFDAVPDGKYIILPRNIYVSEKEGETKSLHFCAVQLEIKDVVSEKTVSNPIPGEFRPLIGKGTTKLLWNIQIPILHLYDGMELSDKKIAGLRVDRPLKSGIRIVSISGTSNDGTKISFHNNYFIPRKPSKASLYIIQSRKWLEAFALLPGTYSIEVRYKDGGTYSLENSYLPLNAVAGNCYEISCKITGKPPLGIIEYDIKKVTGEENEE